MREGRWLQLDRPCLAIKMQKGVPVPHINFWRWGYRESYERAERIVHKLF